MEINNKETYRIQGLSCANCAKQFEDNVKKIKGVSDANVNFAAAKLTITGETTIAEIEKAGAFEQISVVLDGEEFKEDRRPFYLKNLSLFVSFMMFLLGLMSVMYVGEGHIFSTILYATSIIIGGFSLFKTGLLNLIKFRFDMNTLMTIAIIGAAFIGEWQEGAIVVILFAISEMLEKYSMEKARKSIQSIMEIAPKEANVLVKGKIIIKKVESVKVGDTIVVHPGQKISLDGEVIKGISMVNQASITGESIPVTKERGDEVFAGTLNEDSILEIKVTKKYKDSTIAKMIHLVEEANSEKAPAQKFVDKFAKYYTPIIILVALLVAIIPPIIMGADWQTWIYEGLAILVIGCPCALVISTPVAIVTAIGTAAQNGVLIKGGIHLEELAKVNTVTFDKTGTLTVGSPIVNEVITFNGSSKTDFLRAAATLEQASTHPLAKAILLKAKEESIRYQHLEVKDYKALPGKGIVARSEGTLYYLGNLRIFEDKPYFNQLQLEISKFNLGMNSIVILGTNDKLIGIAEISDTVRNTSKEAIEKLKSIGISNVVMLTGDNQLTAQKMAEVVGVTDYYAGLLPSDKLEKIKEYQNNNQRVAMIGDGMNDAPALASANVGIAMGEGGTDTALETANIVLMSDDLNKIPYTIRLSKRAMAIIKQNITFALGLKILALLLVIPGWLTLWIAIFADIGATLLVTFNSLRLLKK